MALIYWGQVDAASDITMAAIVNQSGSRTRAAVVDLLALVAAGVIADDPTVAAAAVAAVEDALAAGEYTPRKCIHREGGTWVWDGPSGLGATHYLLPDHTGAYVVRPTPFPIPLATPALNW